MNQLEAQIIRLKLLDEEIELPYEELEGSSSPHSGRPMKKIGIDLNVPASESAEVTKALNAARDPEEAFVVAGTRWAVAYSSHSYSQGSQVHRYRIELEEVEFPQAERVEMLGLSLGPSRYKEEVLDDGVLMISIIASLDPDEDQVLETALREAPVEKKYFEVIRVGVSEEPIRVRFGRCLWDRRDPQRLHLLRLVADEGRPEEDPDGFELLQQPELGRALEKIAVLEDRIDLLVRHLVEVGALGKESETALREELPDSWNQHFRDFAGPTDLEVFF
jgi:hypothetical protein